MLQTMSIPIHQKCARFRGCASDKESYPNSSAHLTHLFVGDGDAHVAYLVALVLEARIDLCRRLHRFHRRPSVNYLAVIQFLADEHTTTVLLRLVQHVLAQARLHLLNTLPGNASQLEVAEGPLYFAQNEGSAVDIHKRLLPQAVPQHAARLATNCIQHVSETSDSGDSDAIDRYARHLPKVWRAVDERCQLQVLAAREVVVLQHSLSTEHSSITSLHDVGRERELARRHCQFNWQLAGKSRQQTTRFNHVA
jgi:hypothetical protein